MIKELSNPATSPERRSSLAKVIADNASSVAVLQGVDSITSISAIHYREAVEKRWQPAIRDDPYWSRARRNVSAQLMKDQSSVAIRGSSSLDKGADIIPTKISHGQYGVWELERYAKADGRQFWKVKSFNAGE
jgi:hypothetical protein